MRFRPSEPKPKKKKADPETNTALTWFFGGLLALCVIIIIISAVESARPNPYEDKCTAFCEENRSERYSKYGLVNPCKSYDINQCIICFCHVDEITNQDAPYQLSTGNLYTLYYRGI